MTELEAAEWMLERLIAHGCLYQEEAASHLLHLKQGDLTYYDGNSNLCLSKNILTIFNKLTPEYVYERTDKFWRPRYGSDLPGRQQ